jgi:tetratricopeptide (TPR) repeat protein
VSSPGVEDLESRLEQGRCLAKESRWEELSELLEAAVADHPKARKAWIGWGKALKKLGRFEEGAAVMGRAFAANPRSAVFLYNRACFLAGSGHTGPAVECLAKAIAMQPAWQEAAKQDDDFAAIQRDRRFLAAVSHRDPARRLQAKLQRGLTLFERGRYAGAVPVLEAFTEQHPHVLDAWLVIGRCLKELRRPDDAAEAMRRGLEACGRHPRLMYNLACYECLAGRCDEALRALLDAISLHPAYAGVVERDADLDALRSDPRFAAIVSVAGGSWRLREE